MNETILETIKALRSKITENGATEEEAMAALAMADKLMARHGVTEEDLKNLEFKRDMGFGHFAQKQKTTHPCQKFCSRVISEFCGVKSWRQTDPKLNKKISFAFGLHEDVQMYEYLMLLVHNSMNRGWKEFLSEMPKEAGVSRHHQYWSFMMAFGLRINSKIKTLMEVRQESTGTDLIVMKSQLVEEGMKVVLPSLKLNPGKSQSRKVNIDAFLKGTLAGDKVNLSRPVEKKREETVRKLT